MKGVVSDDAAGLVARVQVFRIRPVVVESCFSSLTSSRRRGPGAEISTVLCCTACPPAHAAVRAAGRTFTAIVPCRGTGASGGAGRPV